MTSGPVALCGLGILNRFLGEGRVGGEEEINAHHLFRFAIDR